jgi:hypothetical protein
MEQQMSIKRVLVLAQAFCLGCSSGAATGAEGESEVGEGEGEVGEGEVEVGEGEGELGEGEVEEPLENNFSIYSQEELDEVLTGVEYADEVTIYGPITNLSALASLRSARLHISSNALLTDITLPAFEFGTVSVDETPVERISLPVMTDAGGIFAVGCTALRELDAPLLQTVVQLSAYDNASLATVNLPSLQSAGWFLAHNNPLLTELEASSLTVVTEQLRLYNTGLSDETVAGFELLDDPQD